MTVLFLIGAGASFGSGYCHPYSPPLGGDLFDKLAAFSVHIKQTPNELADLFRKDFESGMSAMADTQRELLGEFQRDMAIYFSQFMIYDQPTRSRNNRLPLILKSSFNNRYQYLLRLISLSDENVIFSTTNYDMLIEEAIESVGKPVSYRFEDNSDFMTILKIHGSCNFLPNLHNGSINNLRFVVGKGQEIIGTGDNCIFRVENFEAVTRLQANFALKTSHSALSAAIAMYEPDKEVIHGPEVVKEQYRRWLTAVSKADRIIVMGLRVHRDSSGGWADEHIWAPLAKSTAKISYVGFEYGDFQSWADENSVVNHEFIGRNFADALEGFKDILCPNMTSKDISSVAIDFPEVSFPVSRKYNL